MNIKRLIKDTFVLKRRLEDLQNAVKANMSNIQAHFDSESIKELDVEGETDGDTPLIAKVMERVTTEWYPEKLQKKLSPEIFNEITNKSYAIIDMDGMKLLLKSHGVDPKAFRKLIRVDQSINREELKRLYSDQEITKSDIKGCFSAKVSKSIKITRKVDG